MIDMIGLKVFRCFSPESTVAEVETSESGSEALNAVETQVSE